MNAVADRFLASEDPAADAPRLREIPYNYTSFSDREIVIRLLGAPLWDVLDELRGERAPAARRACSSRCWATSGWSSAIPICRTTCSTTRSAGGCSSRRCASAATRSRSGALDNARRAATPIPSATRTWRSSSARRARPSLRFERVVPRDRGAAGARRAARAARARRSKDNIAFDGFARVSHVTDATDWRVEYPFVVVFPDTEEECARSSRADRARAHDHPARRRHRLHGRRHSAHAARGGDQHREARCASRRSSAFRSARAATRRSRRSTAARASSRSA